MSVCVSECALHHQYLEVGQDQEIFSKISTQSENSKLNNYQFKLIN